MLIEVEWGDICVNMAWLSEEEAAAWPTTLCLSTRYFLNQDKYTLRLSHSTQPGNFERRDVTSIPVRCIRKIRRLK